ncbi:hypothetical protein ED312_12730 [Sinomicrobium pectinilyticum]|uniref:Uncharacterized protein n=2 Tax=Sinomicrobium pectinilyticum TaxID=1084421 RepID=A0A3N0EBG8_SINP1|nr:hypothetical protein ED312_12730 [Sinomicrobium pectinilyticum]
MLNLYPANVRRDIFQEKIKKIKMKGRVFGITTVLMTKYAGKIERGFPGSLRVVWITFFLFFSCQSEVSEMIGEDPDLVITSGSEMAVWIQRATANNGSADDFLDGYSCGTVKFPVAVSLNGAVRMINNEGDLSIVKRITEELEIPVTLQFPVTILSKGYTEIRVNSAEEFAMLKEMCTRTPEDRITCVSFQYPLEMLTYNANNQSNGSVTIDDDEDFYKFIDQIGNLHTSINYPLVAKYITGEEVEISTNSEMISVVKEGKNICDSNGG